MIFQNTVQSFLKYFNEIDKTFDIILNKDKFTPYNERLKEIVSGDFSISPYIKKYRKVLKHFGELRNELIHGLKIGGKAMFQPTKETIQEIKKHKISICNPLSVGNIFEKDEFFILNTKNIKNKKISDRFQEKSQISNQLYFPVVEDGVLQDVCNVSQNFGHSNIEYKTVSSSFLLLEVQHFYQHCAKKNLQGVLLITKTGKPDSKIEGMVTPFNYAKIFKYL